MITRFRTVSLAICVFLVACGLPQDLDTPEPTKTLRPYQSPTSTPTIPTPIQVTTSPIPIGPSPTPFIHIISEGETLLGIAIRYGLEIDDLLIANPGIEPRILSIGQEINIPAPGGEPIEVLLPTPTPLPIELSGPECYRTPSDGLACLITAFNNTEFEIEGLAVVITLLDNTGEALISEASYAPLFRFPPNSIMPLAAFFGPPLDEYTSAFAQLISAAPADQEQSRYTSLPRFENLDISGTGSVLVNVKGRVKLDLNEGEIATQIKVLAIGLNSSGETVGYHLWDSPLNGIPLEFVPFETTVISLGPPIETIQILAEVKLGE